MTSTRLARWLSRLAVSRPVLVVAIGVVVTIIGVVLTSRLTLQTDLGELLPPRAPSVVALRELADRVGGTGNVAIAVESVDGSPQRLRAYLPRLAGALRTALGPDARSIRYSRQPVTDYYNRFAAYYVPLDDLARWARELSVALAKHNPAYVELDDTAGDPLRALADDVRATREKLGAADQAADGETGLLMTEGGRLGVVFVRPASDSLDLGGSGRMMQRIAAVVAATRPTEAGVRIAGYTGSIPLALGEVEAIEHDIVGTAILVVLGVGAAVLVFFRSIRELALISGAVIVGTAVALGFAALWIGHINAQTAFLGAIIVGTGINYAIIFLDRYRQAQAQDVGFEAALDTACAQTLRATGIAALSTAVSFGVLAAGEIESFHQFGWIGGIGIFTCWLATFTVVPACIVLADRRRLGPRRQHRMGGGFVWLGRLCERMPRRIVAGALLVVVASIALAIAARHDAVETNLRKLGTRSAATDGIEALDNRLRPMDDRSSTPAVIATASRAETQAVCDLLNQRARTDLHGIIQRCYSIDDLFPRDLERRAPALASLRHDLDAVDDAELDPAERADLVELRRALAEPPPATTDLPQVLSEFFTERDGSIGKLAYVEPNDEHLERNLYAFSDAVRSITLPSGKVIDSSGDLVVFADVLRAMRRDATRLTLAAAILTLVVLALVMRRLGSFLRVGAAVLAGVAVMAGVAVELGLRLNFFNFIALPTTFGIGIDYAINIEERIRQRGRGALAQALGEAAPAVVLASLTSIIGYASLLSADSQALASFGALAVIGELACVAVAVVVVPALWALRRRAGRRAPEPDDVVRAPQHAPADAVEDHPYP